MTESALRIIKLSLLIFATIFALCIVWRATRVGVVVSDEKISIPDLFITESDNRRASAKIINQQGVVKKQWNYVSKINKNKFFRYSLPVNDGGLVGLIGANDDEPGELVHLDSNSKVLARVQGRFHHQFVLLENGHFLVLCKEFAVSFNPHLSHFPEVRFDCIKELDWQGNVYWEWSTKNHIDEIIEESNLAEKVNNHDWTHLNTLQVVPHEIPEFGIVAGDILVNANDLSMIMILSRQDGTIKWSFRRLEDLLHSHQPRLNSKNEIITLDNNSNPDFSRIIKIDVLTKKVQSLYQNHGFFGFFGFMLFANGSVDYFGKNLLITHTRWGYLFAVDEKGEKIFEYRATGATDQGIVRMVQYWLRWGDSKKFDKDSNKIMGWIMFAAPMTEELDYSHSNVLRPLVRY